MPGRNCADIVFCIDGSGSMQPTIDAVRNNINSMLEGLTSGGEQGYSWDIRFDFLAFHDNHKGVHFYSNVHTNNMDLLEAIYVKPNPQLFFTRDVSAFRNALSNVKVLDEEEQLLALDIAMDFPWRPSNDCHRVVVLLTDEPVETGLVPEQQKAVIPALIEKIMAKRIKLFIIAPASAAFFELAEADRCEYNAQPDRVAGLRNVDFSKMLAAIGKSVSLTQTYDGGSTEAMPNFCQKSWTVYQGELDIKSDL